MAYVAKCREMLDKACGVAVVRYGAAVGGCWYLVSELWARK